MRPLIDAHLDLAWNALYFDRDLLASVAAVRESERGMTDELARGRNTVTLPELRRAHVPLCVATLIGEVSDIEDHAGAHEFTQQFDPALAQRAVGACAAGIVAAAVVNGPDCA